MLVTASNPVSKLEAVMCPPTMLRTLRELSGLAGVAVGAHVNEPDGEEEQEEGREAVKHECHVVLLCERMEGVEKPCHAHLCWSHVPTLPLTELYGRRRARAEFSTHRCCPGPSE